MVEDKKLRTAEAAKRIGICTKTLRRWVRKGIAPQHYELNGRFIFAKEDIEVFLLSMRKEGNDD